MLQHDEHFRAQFICIWPAYCWARITLCDIFAKFINVGRAIMKCIEYYEGIHFNLAHPTIGHKHHHCDRIDAFALAHDDGRRQCEINGNSAASSWAVEQWAKHLGDCLLALVCLAPQFIQFMPEINDGVF